MFFSFSILRLCDGEFCYYFIARVIILELQIKNEDPPIILGGKELQGYNWWQKVFFRVRYMIMSLTRTERNSSFSYTSLLLCLFIFLVLLLLLFYTFFHWTKLFKKDQTLNLSFYSYKQYLRKSYFPCVRRIPKKLALFVFLLSRYCFN